MDGFMVEDGQERPARKIGVVVSQTHPLVEKNTTETQQ
jgi:hypothetical protein